MNFVNMGLCKADISISKKTERHIANPILNIYTNGLPKIGSCRLPAKYAAAGQRKLDIRNGLHSVYDDVEPFTEPIFCSYNKENKPTLTTNVGSRYIAEKNGSTGVYLIAVPFRRKIVEISVPEYVRVYKTCFTSATQTKLKKPYNWPKDSKNSYFKTLYILCEFDYGSFPLPEDIKHGDPIPGGSIYVTECGLPTDVAKKVLEGNENEENIGYEMQITTTMHTVEIPLLYNNTDDIILDNEPHALTNLDLDPSVPKVKNQKFTGLDAVSIASMIVDKDYSPVRIIGKDSFIFKE